MTPGDAGETAAWRGRHAGKGARGGTEGTSLYLDRIDTNTPRPIALTPGGSGGRVFASDRREAVEGRYPKWALVGKISASGHLGVAEWLGDGPEAVARGLGTLHGGTDGHLATRVTVLPASLPVGRF